MKSPLTRHPAVGLRADRRGVTSIEYALIAVLIITLIVGTVGLTGKNLTATFTRVGAEL
jgi:Flp pilus assembly pilin Flp